MKKTIIAVTIAGLLASGASAALMTTYSNMGNMSSTVGALTNSLTVAAGDVVVMVSGTNKKASVNKLTFSSSATGPVIDLSADAQLGTNPNPNAYLSYIQIGAAGTYDFIGTTDSLGMTANVGLYKLTADSGLIELAANNAKRYSGLALGESSSVTNFMAWSGNENYADYDGITTIGVASSLKGVMVNINSVGGFILDINKSGKRFAGTSDRTGNGNVKHIWDITAADAESGGITGAVFAEVIPEPATLGLIASFGAGILFIRRRFML